MRRALIVLGLFWVWVGVERTGVAGELSTLLRARASSVESVSLYRGEARTRRLVEGARQEGRLTVYTPLSTQVLDRVVGAFRRWLRETHGLESEVTVWRGSSEDVLRRSLLEARAGRREVDVIDANGNVVEILRREGVTGRFWSPYFADYMEEVRDPQGYWHATRLQVFTQAYNTHLVGPEDLPRTWVDLLDSRWYARMAVEASDWDWFATVVKRGPFRSQEDALAFFERLREQNIQVRSGHTLLAELLAAGEIPLVLTQYNYVVESLKERARAPVDWLVLEPAVARPSGVAVAANSPHPHLAMLMVDFMLSPAGQSVLEQVNIAPASSRVRSRLTQGFRYVLVDVGTTVDESQLWQRRWEEWIGLN